MPAFPNMYMDFDWAPLDVPMEDMGDFKSVDWAIRQLGRRHEKPFFLACGIYRPHNPWYVPRKFYEMFPLESVKLPRVMENDLADVGDRAREIAHRGGGYHRHVIEAGLWKNAVQGYLAAIAFADELLGRLLDALKRSPYAANTIVAAWSSLVGSWERRNIGGSSPFRENVVRNVLMIKAPPGLPGFGAAPRPAGVPTGSSRWGISIRLSSISRASR